MSRQPDDGCYAALLKLAGVGPADHDDRVVIHTLLQTGRDELGADGVVVLLVDPAGAVRVAGATNHTAQELGMGCLRHGGPILQAHRDGRTVEFPGDNPAAWHRFRAVARQHGVHSVHAAPVALHAEAFGALGLYWDAPTRLPDDEARFVAALARMAAVGIINRREFADRDTRTRQLQEALESRILIEQAKGMLAERAKTNPSSAFELMRATARTDQRRVADVARDVLAGMSTAPSPGPAGGVGGRQHSLKGRSAEDAPRR